MIKKYIWGQVEPEEIFRRVQPTREVTPVVSEMIQTVRQQGDAALFAYTQRFDGVQLSALAVSAEEIDEALAQVGQKFLDVLQRAAENIRRYHQHQMRSSYLLTDTPGVVLGQRVIPLQRVGVYVPGGTAAYPSCVLMNCIPAKIAGVEQLVMVTPPGRDGKVNPGILAAAKVAGVDQIYKVGGAQAVAALAYGTESIPQVDKIVGPGNAFVAEAKRQVFGQVAIDMIAGPSEILVIADASCDAKVLAADLLSQAEHDKQASAVLITNDEALADEVSRQLETQIPLLHRAQIARHSIDENGKIIVTDDLQKAIEVANRIAPEHLELCVENPFDYLSGIRNAGSVFLGCNCPEPLGDYFAGTNHVLPTGGTARFSSPLSVDDFVKKSSFMYYTQQALQDVSEDVAFFAEQEGLTAHAKSITVRFEEDRT